MAATDPGRGDQLIAQAGVEQSGSCPPAPAAVHFRGVEEVVQVRGRLRLGGRVEAAAKFSRRSIAALAAWSAIVLVGPPLSAGPAGSSFGSPLPKVAGQDESEESPDLAMLWPLSVIRPMQSGDDAALVRSELPTSAAVQEPEEMLAARPPKVRSPGLPFEANVELRTMSAVEAAVRMPPPKPGLPAGRRGRRRGHHEARQESEQESPQSPRTPARRRGVNARCAGLTLAPMS